MDTGYSNEHVTAEEELESMAFPGRRLTGKRKVLENFEGDMQAKRQAAWCSGEKIDRDAGVEAGGRVQGCGEKDL